MSLPAQPARAIDALTEAIRQVMKCCASPKLHPTEKSLSLNS
jgi:hypothetical protein